MFGVLPSSASGVSTSIPFGAIASAPPLDGKQTTIFGATAAIQPTSVTANASGSEGTTAPAVTEFVEEDLAAKARRVARFGGSAGSAGVADDEGI
jgi:hypothetical protein